MNFYDFQQKTKYLEMETKTENVVQYPSVKSVNEEKLVNVSLGRIFIFTLHLLHECFLMYFIISSLKFYKLMDLSLLLYVILRSQNKTVTLKIKTFK